MKKILIIFLCLILVGCSPARKIDEEKYSAYRTYYNYILEAENKKSTSNSFDIELVVNKLQDDNYRYDVIIDNPRVAMYNVKVLAIKTTLDATVNNEEMMPSVGILEDDVYYMIPNQIDRNKNYVKGLLLTCYDKKSSLRVDVMVSFTDSDGSNSQFEYFSLYTSYVGETNE